MFDLVPGIIVEMTSTHLDLAAQWRALSDRAAANVFMHPVVINAAQATTAAGARVITAWDGSGGLKRLAGVWAVRLRRAWPGGPRYLTAPAYDHSFVSNPVVDPAMLDSVVPAFLDTLARDPSLPQVVRIRYLDGGADTYPALMRALTDRHARVLTLSRTERAYALPGAGAKRSGSTRKKLRQDWNRLAAEGAVDVVNDREPAAVLAAFEAFLALEASSWKAGRGTAILSDAANARFARGFIAALAAEGGASVALLRVDGEAIAAQVLLYSGRTAYTWKTAFNPGRGKHSPGALLVDRVTDTLLASGAIDAIESCSPDGGFMARLWTGRRTTVDLLVDLGPRRSLTFDIVALQARGYAGLKDLRDRLRARWHHVRTRSAAAASAARASDA